MDQPGGRQAGIMQPVCQTALQPLRLHASAPSPWLPMTHGVKRTSRGSVSPSSCRKLRIGCNSADFMILRSMMVREMPGHQQMPLLAPHHHQQAEVGCPGLQQRNLHQLQGLLMPTDQLLQVLGLQRIPGL